MQLFSELGVPKKRRLDRLDESEFVDPVVPAPGLNQIRPSFELRGVRVAIRLKTEKGWEFVSKGEGERSYRRR
jgi:hypothetical protein